MSAYNVGDLVEAKEKDGETVVRGRVTAVNNIAGGWLVVGSVSGSLSFDDWLIIVVEQAPEPLPTEDGWYSVVVDGDPRCRLLRILGGEVQEFLPSGRSADKFHTPEDLAQIAVRESRLTRLRPEAETARAVLNTIRSVAVGDGGYYDHQFTARQLREVGAEFGVTS